LFINFSELIQNITNFAKEKLQVKQDQIADELVLSAQKQSSGIDNLVKQWEKAYKGVMFLANLTSTLKICSTSAFCITGSHAILQSSCNVRRRIICRSLPPTCALSYARQSLKGDRSNVSSS